MKYNILGRTDLRVSQLGFGCGSIGGLLVRGDYPTMRQVVSRALELGINYFDTAPLYGNGQSEVNLGAVIRELRAEVLIGTKVRLTGEDVIRIGEAITRSVEGSLRRLGRETIDLIQLHNLIGLSRQPERDWIRIVLSDLDAVLEAFGVLQQQGKVRFWGITGLGESDTLRQAVGRGGFQTIQVPYNLLNPTAFSLPGLWTNHRSCHAAGNGSDRHPHPGRRGPDRYLGTTPGGINLSKPDCIGAGIRRRCCPGTTLFLPG